MPEHRGDWTDFWHFGAGSTSLESALNAKSKQKLFSSGLLATALPPTPRLKNLQSDAWDEVVCYDEHTWGMDCQSSRPYHAHSLTAGMRKRIMAHDGQELARYVLASRLSDYAGNSVMQETKGLLAVNPSPLPLAASIKILPRWRKIFGHLNGFQFRHSEAQNPIGEFDSFPDPGGNMVQVEVPPFSSVRIPWDECKPPEESGDLSESTIDFLTESIESATHILEYHPEDGRITRLYDKSTGWEVLSEGGEYDLMSPVHEKADPQVDPTRQSFYKQDGMTERTLGSCWNPDWKATRSGPQSFAGCRVVRDARSISLIREYALEGAPRVIQKFELSADHPWIETEIIIHKDKIETMDSLYFASKLNLDEGWKATFDASGVPVKLDEEQLEHTSRGWITAEAFTQMEDSSRQFSVFAPTIPLTQLGNFHFGKPPVAIPRQAQPLHLLWAYNNYWETNFPASQEGVIRLECSIHTSSPTSNSETYRLADAYARKPLFLPLGSCEKKDTSSLLTIDNPAVRLLSVDTARFSGGTIYRFANNDETPQTCQVDVGSKVVGAMLVTPTEEKMGECRCDGQLIEFQIPARGVVSLLLEG